MLDEIIKKMILKKENLYLTPNIKSSNLEGK
jgi:hypothetical protein